MPIPENMMFSRPKNCRYCGNGYYALLHVINYAQSKGFNVIDASAENANKGPIYAAIDAHDPASFYGFGHGNETTYTADAEEPVFTVDECDKLSGRVVYLLSCLTGVSLGYEIINQGALAYAGFNISWTWMSEGGTDIDPYEDKYAKCFFESANELWVAICDGEEFYDAVQRSRGKYDAWIDYWFYDNPEDPYSQDCIKWLSHDRDGLVGLDACSLLTTEENCSVENCYWYYGSCHSVPVYEPPPPQPKIAYAAIPMIAIICIGLIVGQK